MRSKAYHAFQQKLHYFDDDIELIDVLRLAVLDGDLTDTTTTHVLRHIDPARHTHLARRQNSAGSRRLIIYHLRSSLYSSYTKDIYEELTHYLRTILERASLAGFNSGRIIGEHSFKVEAKAILGLGNWEEVCRIVAESVFQALEAERSTLRLLEKMASKLGLTILPTTIAAALPFLEARHLLVHADGRASAEYIAAHPQIRCDDGYIVLSYAFISGLRNSIQTLVAEFDQQIIAKNLLRAEDTQP